MAYLARVLLDENCAGYYWDLKHSDVPVLSVTKLRGLGMKLRSDLSVLKFAEREHLIFVTSDKGNVLSCQENNIPFVYVNSRTKSNDLVKQLNNLVVNQSSASLNR